VLIWSREVPGRSPQFSREEILREAPWEAREIAVQSLRAYGSASFAATHTFPAALLSFGSFSPEAKAQIIRFCKHRITSAKIESFNAHISRVMHKACGIANLDSLCLKLRQASLQT
jgi:hypothetical protein